VWCHRPKAHHPCAPLVLERLPQHREIGEAGLVAHFGAGQGLPRRRHGRFVGNDNGIAAAQGELPYPSSEPFARLLPVLVKESGYCPG
jgi:hypothetical protein